MKQNVPAKRATATVLGAKILQLQTLAFRSFLKHFHPDTSTCSTITDLCVLEPCKHGICKTHYKSYTCECYADWEGKNCTEEITDCRRQSGYFSTSYLHENLPY